MDTTFEGHTFSRKETIQESRNVTHFCHFGGKKDSYITQNYTAFKNKQMKKIFPIL